MSGEYVCMILSIMYYFINFGDIYRTAGMNGTASSRLTLNGEGVTAKMLMLISVQDKVGCRRL